MHPPEPSAGPPQFLPKWAVWALFALTALAFLPTAGFGYVLDDGLIIVENTATHSLANIGLFFQTDLWATTAAVGDGDGDTPYYRPLLLLDLAIDRAIFGLDHPGIYHLGNVGWHLTGMAALWSILGSLGLGRDARWLGLWVFAVHPLQAEAVAYLSSRNDVLAGALMLWGLALLLKQGAGPGRWASGALLLLAATLTKEMALLAPVLLGALLWARGSRLRSMVGPMGAALAALLAYGLVRLWAGVPWPERTPLDDALAQTMRTAALYSAEFFWPVRVVPGTTLLDTPTPHWALLPGALLVAALWALGGRRAAMGLVVAALSLAPSMMAVLKLGLVPDRYLYLPMAGVGLAMAAAWEGLAGRLPRFSVQGARPTLVLALVLAVVGVGGIGFNIQHWADDPTLADAMVDQTPTRFAYGFRGKLREKSGDLDGAAADYRHAVAAPRPFPHSCYNMANVHLKRRDPAAAVRDGAQALANGCHPSPELVARMALAHALMGEWADAETLARVVVKGGPDPTGQGVVVGAAAAVALRQDTGPLDAALAKGGGAPEALYTQVAWVLKQGGATEAAAWFAHYTREGRP